MKKLNLNIKLDKPVLNEKNEEMKAYDVAILWIKLQIERAVNNPKFNSRTERMEPTTTVNMDVQRKYGKLMDSLESHKKGIAEIEDDDFDFLYRKFQNQAESALQRDINKILLEIDRHINLAKIEKPEKEKDKNKNKK